MREISLAFLILKEKVAGGWPRVQPTTKDLSGLGEKHVGTIGQETTAGNDL